MLVFEALKRSAVDPKQKFGNRQDMKDFEKMAQRSESVEEALLALHEAGASPVHAIKALCNGRGLSLSSSKEQLMASPSWHAEAAAANRLHEQLDELLNEEDDNNGS